MSVKALHLSALLLALPLITSAQDKIFKTSGAVIDAKVKSIDPRFVTYVRFDNQSGPVYSIGKREVEKIVYQDGTEEKITTARPRLGKTKSDGDAAVKPAFGPNIIALAPLQFTEHGLGFDLSYERSLDSRGIISFYVPAIFVLNLNNATRYNYNTGTYDNGHQDKMFYVMPGIKIYPTGNQGIVRYALGPSVVYASGEKSREIYNGTSGNPTYITESQVMLGMVINNSLNINPTPHIYLGLEFGFGFTYLNQVASVNQNTNGLAQGSFKIGYRF